MEPELTNLFDAKAIQIKYKVDGMWKRLVSEVLDEVHEALKANRIVSVDFEWIKLIVIWRTPGWYAGELILHKKVNVQNCTKSKNIINHIALAYKCSFTML